LKKEITHKCGDGLVYSNKKGKCINPKLEELRKSGKLVVLE